MSQNPLSIGSAVVGLVVAAGRITLGLHQFINSVRYAPKSALAVFAEVKNITAALNQLQAYLIGAGRTEPARRPLLSLENIVVTVTGCVTTYSELELITKKCFDKQPKGVFTRLEWTLRETEVNKIIDKLQNHKSSLILMLTILQCETMGEAETAMERLCRLVESLLQSNAHLQARLVSVEASQVTGPPFTPVQQSPDDRISTVSFVPDHSMLNDTLKRSRVYKRTWNRDSTFTTTSSKREPLALSAFSDLSLGNVSVVSVFCLPIWSSDLSNSEHYSFGSDQAGLTNLFLNEPAYQDLPEIPEMLEPEPAPTL